MSATFGNSPSNSYSEEQARLAAIVESSDDVIIGKNLDGIIQSWNRAAERIFGYTAQEMIGKSMTLLIPADRPDEEAQILQRLKRGERVDHFETVRVRKDGRRIDVSVTISPIRDATGRIIGASKVARDITQLKQMLRDREQLLESEQAARREAERVSRAKDEFLSTLSHELRTPLNAILGWAQVLRTATPTPDDLAQGLETIERNARVQTQLIDELLDMSRIITGKVRLDVQRVDLPVVISETVESMRPTADAKGVKLYKVLDPRAGPVTGDPNRLRQVLWNLLSNAIKFTPKGGQVQVFLQLINSHIELMVSDTGQGIKADFLPQLFTRFAQADASTTRRHGGLGLGLAIVRHLVELHGGTVRASSRGEGEGATFIITLPLMVAFDHRSHEDAAHPTTTRPAPPFSINLGGAKVLVVDDEADARGLIKRILEANNATVLTAESAAQALELLPREHPALLLCDIGMPGMDGYQLLDKVRGLPASEGGDIPAVALTAFARSEDRRRALTAGFQLHVAKPIEAAELIAVVANLTGVVGRGAR